MRITRVPTSQPSLLPERVSRTGRSPLVVTIASEHLLESVSIGQRGPAFALDGERSGARCRRGRLPGIALAVIVNEERRGEDVPGAGGVDLPRPARPHLVALPVDEEQGAIPVGRE